MLAIAGAAIAAGVEGFSAVGPARSFGVRQVSVIHHQMTRNVCVLLVMSEDDNGGGCVCQFLRQRAESMIFPRADCNSIFVLFLLTCEFTDDNQITSHAHSSIQFILVNTISPPCLRWPRLPPRSTRWPPSPLPPTRRVVLPWTPSPRLTPGTWVFPSDAPKLVPPFTDPR